MLRKGHEETGMEDAIDVSTS